MIRAAVGATLLALPVSAMAAGPVESGSAAKLPVNLTAIAIFLLFVAATLLITY